jgi:FkbM family methyltransferase
MGAGGQPQEFPLPGGGTVLLRPGTSDLHTYRQVFVRRDYDFELLRAPQTIVDAGANIGLATLWFARRYPGARILALEPEPANFALLAKNTTQFPNVTAIHGALWKDRGEIQIVDPGYGSWGFQTRAAAGVSSDGRVKALAVDDIMKDHGLASLDLLKIDIEGAEVEVFETAARWIDRVQVLVVELHDHLRIGCNRSFYNATNSFPMEQRLGENILCAREGWLREVSTTPARRRGRSG